MFWKKNKKIITKIEPEIDVFIKKIFEDEYSQIEYNNWAYLYTVKIRFTNVEVKLTWNNIYKRYTIDITHYPTCISIYKYDGIFKFAEESTINIILDYKNIKKDLFSLIDTKESKNKSDEIKMKNFKNKILNST